MPSLRDKVISSANPLKGTKVSPPAVQVAAPAKPRSADELKQLDSLEEAFDIEQLKKIGNTV